MKSYVTNAKDAINNRMSLYSSSSTVLLSGVKSLRHKFSRDEPILATEAAPSNSILQCERLNTNDKGFLVDSQNRRITLKGINLDAGAKLPASPPMPTYQGDCTNPENVFFDGDNVCFVGRPFALEEAELHIQRIKLWGYNCIRYIITWEAIEHEGPGIYDDEFIKYTSDILEIIHRVGGLYVFIDVHQDVWSRYSGGSGAPLWTLYAAGLQPKRFAQTEAAILHNDPKYHNQDGDYGDSFPKMIWPTNYKRLAAMVMFTMFFSGKNYFPHLKLNGQNIQSYLQSCFFKSVKRFWQRISRLNTSMIDDGTLFGFETLNEPNCGLIGHDHLGFLPDCQQLRVGTTPTAYQAFKLGMGFACEVDVYRITVAGPQKYGTEVVDPKGERAWLTVDEAKAIDSHYGWTRSDDWIVGECVFLQNGIWNFSRADISNLKEMLQEDRLLASTVCELCKPNYFNQFSSKHNFKMYSGVKPKKIDMEFFINNNFVDFIGKFKKVIRGCTPDVFFMLQPPVLETPPNLKTDPRNIVDKKTIYCPHYYDGMSLMFKTWNPRYNVDTLGIMRGRYLNPVLGIVFGERAIRNCLKKQFNEMKKECEEYLGCLPILMSETGMPFDMDDKRAYTNGRYSSQTLALDAISYALEGLTMSHAYWCYTSINCHKWGDRWNNEDFSFWSPDDRNLTFVDTSSVGEILSSTVSSTASYLTKSKKINSLKNKVKREKEKSKEPETVVSSPVNEPKNGQIDSSSFTLKDIENDLMELNLGSEKYNEESDDYDDLQSLQDSSLISWTADNVKYRHSKRCYPSPDGLRAAGAVVRPYVIACAGDLVATEFDLRTVKFSLTASFSKDASSKPTIIFVPKWHYPKLNYHDIYLSSGYIRYNEQLEYIEWYQDGKASEQETIIIKNHSGTLDNINNEENQKENGCVIT